MLYLELLPKRECLLQHIVYINQTEHLLQPHDQDAPQLLDTKVSSLLCSERVGMLWMGAMIPYD